MCLPDERELECINCFPVPRTNGTKWICEQSVWKCHYIDPKLQGFPNRFWKYYFPEPFPTSKLDYAVSLEEMLSHLSPGCPIVFVRKTNLLQIFMSCGRIKHWAVFEGWLRGEPYVIHRYGKKDQIQHLCSLEEEDDKQPVAKPSKKKTILSSFYNMFSPYDEDLSDGDGSEIRIDHLLKVLQVENLHVMKIGICDKSIDRVVCQSLALEKAHLALGLTPDLTVAEKNSENFVRECFMYQKQTKIRSINLEINTKLLINYLYPFYCMCSGGLLSVIPSVFFVHGRNSRGHAFDGWKITFLETLICIALRWSALGNGETWMKFYAATILHELALNYLNKFWDNPLPKLKLDGSVTHGILSEILKKAMFGFESVREPAEVIRQIRISLGQRGIIYTQIENLKKIPKNPEIEQSRRNLVQPIEIIEIWVANKFNKIDNRINDILALLPENQIIFELESVKEGIEKICLIINQIDFDQPQIINRSVLIRELKSIFMKLCSVNCNIESAKNVLNDIQTILLAMISRLHGTVTSNETDLSQFFDATELEILFSKPNDVAWLLIPLKRLHEYYRRQVQAIVLQHSRQAAANVNMLPNGTNDTKHD